MRAKAGVVELMATQCTGVGEATATLLTAEWKRSSVDDLVLQFVGQLRKPTAAVCAGEWHDAGVLALMHTQDSAGSEPATALVAHVSPFAGMNAFMILQV